MKKLLWVVAVLAFTNAHAVDLGHGLPFDQQYLHVHHAPDPVNPRNGNFYLPLPDYYQPCFGFPLEVYRSYNSFSSKNGPFGRGWTFNYDIQIIVGEKGSLQIIEPDGFVNTYISLESAQQNQKVVIQKIIEAKKQEDIKYMKNKEGKGEAYYKDIGAKLAKDPEFLKRQKERYLAADKDESTSGKYVSYNRGTTYVTKTSSGYTRTTEIGQTEEYDTGGYIKKISDRNGNQLRFNYDKLSRVSKVLDNCGNYLDITYNGVNKISKIKDSYSHELSYSYNKELFLTSSIGSDKQEMDYTYDKNNRMDSILFKEDASKTTVQYEPSTGRVLSQKGPGKKVTTYEYTKNGHVFTTRIKDNEGENTLYEYNDVANKVSQTDSSGIKTTTVLSTCCGKPILIESSNGIHETFDYDDKGNLTARTDTKGAKTTFQYEPRFTQVSEINDSNGEIIRYRYDSNSNLSFAKKTSADGKTSSFVKLTYESHGKIDDIVDDQDQEVKFTYSKIGKPTSIELWKAKKKVSEIRVQYKTDGTMDNLEYVPNNAETANVIKQTLKAYLLLLKPAGIDFEI